MRLRIEFGPLDVNVNVTIKNETDLSGALQKTEALEAKIAEGKTKLQGAIPAPEN